MASGGIIMVMQKMRYIGNTSAVEFSIKEVKTNEEDKVPSPT